MVFLPSPSRPIAEPIGGKDSHEFILISESGEDQIVQCQGCGFAANMERASGVKPDQPRTAPLPLEEVSTPGIKTIKGLAEFLGVPESRTLKAVFYSADGEMVFVVIRGDLEVNDVKLKNLLHATRPPIRHRRRSQGGRSGRRLRISSGTR